jgi:hypothetical protein
MTPMLQHTLCDHAAGNYRILTTLAAELLAAAAQRELPQLDEKLYLEVFAQPERPAPRRAGGGSLISRPTMSFGSSNPAMARQIDPFVGHVGKSLEPRPEGGHGDRGINAAVSSPRLCRESPLTPWRAPTLKAVVGDGAFTSPTAASRRVRGLGQSPRICSSAAALARPRP